MKTGKFASLKLAPGLVLFARQFVRSGADAEDIVQEAFVRFWRKQHSVQNRALLFSAVRSIAFDLLRNDARRARREAVVVADAEHSAVRRSSIPQPIRSGRSHVRSINCRPNNAKCSS